MREHTLISSAQPHTFYRSTMPVLFLLVLALTLVMLGALCSGARSISMQTVLNAFLHFDDSNFDHHAIFQFRLPRLAAAVLVGAAMALTGALLQALIRNPLAEPQLLGLNSGAALSVVAFSVFGVSVDQSLRPLLAALGSFAAFTIVLGLSSLGRTGATPLKVTLCGIVISAFASAMTSALLLIDDQAIDDLRLWLAGDLGGQNAARIGMTAPFIGIGVLAAMLIASRLSIMSLGDNIARGLGIQVGAIRFYTVSIAALLCGSAVTLAGPIGFIGLIVPHLTARLSKQNLHLQFLMCLIGGPLLLISADILARQIIAPMEISTGIVTGGLGAVVFIVLVARYFR